jgi:hypothetical protein
MMVVLVRVSVFLFHHGHFKAKPLGALCSTESHHQARHLHGANGVQHDSLGNAKIDESGDRHIAGNAGGWIEV